MSSLIQKKYSTLHLPTTLRPLMCPNELLLINLVYCSQSCWYYNNLQILVHHIQMFTLTTNGALPGCPISQLTTVNHSLIIAWFPRLFCHVRTLVWIRCSELLARFDTPQLSSFPIHLYAEATLFYALRMHGDLDRELLFFSITMGTLYIPFLAWLIRWLIIWITRELWTKLKVGKKQKP